MAQDFGDGYSGRIDQQQGDIRTGATPRTFNRDNSIASPAGSPSEWQSLTAPNLNSVNPYVDPSLNNFMRGMGFDQAQIGANAQRHNSYLNQQLTDQRPLWADQLRNGLQGISDNAEGRGMWSSGQRLQDQNNFQSNQNQQQLAYENGIHQQQGENSAGAQEQLLGLARQQAEQELAARQRVAMAQVQSQANPMLMQFLNSALQGS